MKYQPPYSISQEILNRVAAISEAVGRLTVATDQARALRHVREKTWRMLRQRPRILSADSLSIQAAGDATEGALANLVIRGTMEHEGKSAVDVAVALKVANRSIAEDPELALTRGGISGAELADVGPTHDGHDCTT